MVTKEQIKDKLLVIPDILRFLKEKVDENGKEAFENLNGIGGALIKLFTKDIVDNYFSKLEDKSLSEFNLKEFLKASFNQVNKSLKALEHDFKNTTLDYNKFHYEIEKTFQERQKEFNIDRIANLQNIYYLNSYAPIVFIRELAENILRFYEQEEVVNKFLKHFNSNIKESIKEELSEEEYKKLLEKIDKHIQDKKELEFLEDMERLSRIGFATQENLSYMPTLGEWKRVSEYKNLDERKGELEEIEANLIPVGRCYLFYQKNKTIMQR